MTVAHAPREQVIEGQRVLVVGNQSALPAKLSGLLAEMAPFGFSERDDFTLAGTRPACEVLRVHRWRIFRVGRWSNLRDFEVAVGHDKVDGQVVPRTITVTRGVRNLRLEMCADCGAVMVRDLSTHSSMGGRAARIVNQQTGVERIAPAVGTRDLTIGWYSGKRRAGREYR